LVWFFFFFFLFLRFDRWRRKLHLLWCRLFHLIRIILLFSMRYCRSDRRDPAGWRADDAPMGRFRWLRFDMSVPFFSSLYFSLSRFLPLMSFSALIVLPSRQSRMKINLLTFFAFSNSEKCAKIITRVDRLTQERKLSVVITHFFKSFFCLFFFFKFSWHGMEERV
jgi:hypothetical protein